MLALAVHGQVLPDQKELEEIVVESTPVIGAGLDRDWVPEATHALGADDIERSGIPSLTGALLARVPAATVNDTDANPFQPDILYRGFTASPVAGTPQGLAIYVNGARFNDAFGDTVNWDLLPPTAIESAVLEASNPLFGLNALGGSLSVRLKDGFADRPSSLTAYGGSFGRGALIAEASAHDESTAVYATADVTHDDGFRQTGNSDLQRLYSDLGWRGGGAELHLGLTAAHDKLGNPGASPTQALAANLSTAFTAPNEVDNDFLGLNARGTASLGGELSAQGVAYFQRLGQRVPNGTTVEVSACGPDEFLLCNDDGSVLTTTGGQPVSNFLNGGPYSGLSVQQLDSHAYGASAQLNDAAPAAGLANRLVAGASFDGSDSVFSGAQWIGGFNAYTREFLGPGVLIDQPSEATNPVQVRSVTRFYAMYATDTLALGPDMELTLAGRFNDARIDLTDELGGPVSGRHVFDRFDWSAGLSYRASAALQLYGNVAQTNRAPTPQELSCASAATPCSLLNFFVGDPDLKQVIAHTLEAGARGRPLPWLRWNVDAYHTLSTDDIIYESTLSNPNLAFYTNAGLTLRRGIEGELQIEAQRLRASLGVAITDAVFRTPLLLNSPNNPAADAAGQEMVEPGDRIPGIPRQRLSIVLDGRLTERWGLGCEMLAQGGAFRFGDEANLTRPVAGYALVNLNASYRAGRHLAVFAVLDNVFDRHYYTYGSFGPVGDVPWPNVPGGVSDPRTASPGAPLAAYGGVRLDL